MGLIHADDYFEAAADIPGRCELIDGVIVSTLRNWRHQCPSGGIAAHLLAWAEGTGHGFACISVDMILDEHNVFAPDAWWLSDPSSLDPDEYFRGVPDLAVEVRSPSTWHYDVGVKRTRYEQHGLPELWLVDTSDRTVLVLRRSAPGVPGFDVEVKVTADEVLTSPLLPGFELRLADVLAG